MIAVPLQPVANQSFTVTLGGSRYAFALKESNGIMCADVVRDEVELLHGHRLVASAPMLPYRFLQDRGNFVLLTENDELPYYTQFGYTQQLVYLTADEVGTLKASTCASS
jgi:hypothetical protein